MLGIPCIQILVRKLFDGLELMYGNRFLKSGAHCMRNVYIVWEVCTLYGKCVHCMGNVQICERRAHCMGSVYIVWEVCTLYGKCVHCMGSVYIVWETCKFVGDVHIVWEVCTLYGKRVHLMKVIMITSQSSP